MRLRNLLHIKENDIHLIGSLTPPFFFRASEIMEEFIRLCEQNSIEHSLERLIGTYPPAEVADFQQRLDKVKDKLFVDNDHSEANTVDFDSKIRILTLNVTRKCNLKCDYCFEDSEWRKGGEMSFEVAKKAIDTFFITPSNTPDWVIIFTGGEPLLNFALLKEVVEYVEEKGLKVEYKIKTNATLLDDTKMDFLIKNNFKIQISLDGNQTAHDTHRKFANGKGSFEMVDKVIKKLIEKNYGSNVSITGTLTCQTSKYVDDCYVHLKTYNGILNYSLKPVMTNLHNQYAFNFNDYKQIYSSTLKHSKYLVLSGQKLLDGVKNINICGIGVWNIAIDIDGKIYPCYRMCGNSSYIIGTLDLLEIPMKLPKELENIYRLENNTQCANCYLIDVCKIGCYTDKLLYKYDNCFQYTKTVIDEMLSDALLNKEMYLLLDIR